MIISGRVFVCVVCYGPLLSLYCHRIVIVTESNDWYVSAIKHMRNTY